VPPETKTILVVEDEQTLRETLAYNLTREGYRVLDAGDGRTAIDVARSQRPDLVLLDLMLPEVDGFAVLRTIRQELQSSILILTARDSEAEIVLGLELGADDYVTKPFALSALLARVKAVLRRGDRPGGAGPLREHQIAFGDFVLDRAGRRLWQGPREVPLTMKEFDVLDLLVTHPGEVLAREVLLEKVWGYEFAGDSRTVDVHIRWLRAKIERDPADPRHIITVRGVGYRFEDET
jgi:DNA-binding response OmpR family regulator